MITQEDLNLVSAFIIKAYIKIEILNEDDTIYDVLTGMLSDGTSTIDGESSMRRSFSVTLSPINQQSIVIAENTRLWIDKEFKLYVGLERNDKTYKWYPQGRYVLISGSGNYDSSTNSLSITCNDLWAKLDGSIGGDLFGALNYEQPNYYVQEDGSYKYITIRETLINIIKNYTNIKKYVIDEIGENMGIEFFNQNYEQYRKNNPEWNYLPYSLEYSSSDNVGNMISDVISLYPNFDAAFDENGVFKTSVISNNEEDAVELTNDNINQVFISENSNIDTTTVRNVSEVWGKSIDVDFYTEICSTSGDLLNATIDGYTEYKDKDVIGLKINSSSFERIKVNDLNECAVIYDENIEVSLKINTTYVFKVCKKMIYDINGNITKNYYFVFKYMGQYQPHALSVLSNRETIKNGYVNADGKTLDTYSEEYFKDKYNVETVHINICKDSSFVVQKIGERQKVYSGDEFDNITSDSLALSRADYQNKITARLNDTITIKTRLMPFLKENIKVSYIKKNETELKQYIIKKIIHDFNEGTSSITMYSFYENMN